MCDEQKWIYFIFHTVDPSTASITPIEVEDEPHVLEALYKTMPVRNASALNVIATETPEDSKTGDSTLSKKLCVGCRRKVNLDSSLKLCYKLKIHLNKINNRINI